MRSLTSKISALMAIGAVLSGAACSGTDNTTPPGSTGGVTTAGGSPSTGGTIDGAGASSLGGAPATGGANATGGAKSTGGTISAGGAATGGTTATGGAKSTGGATNSAGMSATGGTKATGCTIATGCMASTGGMMTTGGIASTGGTKATGGTASTGGSKATGGMTSTGGTTSAGGTTSTGTVFRQCRFHFGTIQGKATSAGVSMISQIDFFTPGWMMVTFSQTGLCTVSAPTGALAGKVPVDVVYIAANYVKSQHALCDCNVAGCSGGNLCNYGSQYITQDWAAILAAYTSNSTGLAGCLGGRPIIFEMEPDWYQYISSGQSQPWSAALAGTNMTALVNALKGSLPNARFSMDISPWIASNGSAWYPNFNMGLFTFISTSGGGTDAGNVRIRANNSMTWAGVK